MTKKANLGLPIPAQPLPAPISLKRPGDVLDHGVFRKPRMYDNRYVIGWNALDLM